MNPFEYRQESHPPERAFSGRDVRYWLLCSTILTCAIVLVIFFAAATGIVGIRYLRVIDNDPMHHPMRVVKLEKQTLTLADGRRFSVSQDCFYLDELQEIITESDAFVDIETDARETRIYFKRPRFICGTPWARGIQIPLIADEIDENRRELLDTLPRVP